MYRCHFHILFFSFRHIHLFSFFKQRCAFLTIIYFRGLLRKMVTWWHILAKSSPSLPFAPPLVDVSTIVPLAPETLNCLVAGNQEYWVSKDLKKMFQERTGTTQRWGKVTEERGKVVKVVKWVSFQIKRIYCRMIFKMPLCTVVSADVAIISLHRASYNVLCFFSLQ